MPQRYPEPLSHRKTRRPPKWAFFISLLRIHTSRSSTITIGARANAVVVADVNSTAGCWLPRILPLAIRVLTIERMRLSVVQNRALGDARWFRRIDRFRNVRDRRERWPVTVLQ